MGGKTIYEGRLKSWQNNVNWGNTNTVLWDNTDLMQITIKAHCDKVKGMEIKKLGASLYEVKKHQVELDTQNVLKKTEFC